MGQISTPYLLICFAVTLLGINSLRPIASRVGLLDFPGGRKTHFSSTRLVEGLGIFGGLLITGFFLPCSLNLARCSLCQL